MNVILQWQSVWTGPVVMLLAGIVIAAVLFLWDANHE
jgi:hypothetical protein